MRWTLYYKDGKWRIRDVKETEANKKTKKNI